MLQRIWALAIKAVVVAVVILGGPLFILVPVATWNSDVELLNSRADVIARLVDRAALTDDTYTVERLQRAIGNQRTQIVVHTSTGRVVRIGAPIKSPTIHANATTSNGVTTDLWTSAWPTIWRIVGLEVVVISGCGIAIAVAWILARNAAAKLASPLVYLAAQAEQIGAGNVRVKMDPCGIEEIDLVQEELVRSSERMSGRLAAEREFTANASHQLRTPLTALSMRLEEIQLMTDDPQVREEATHCLEQTERLTGVIKDLMDASQERNRGNARAIQLGEIFAQQADEWRIQFERLGRTLEFSATQDFVVLVTPGSLSQIIATLLENSLKYGAGTTRVVAQQGNSRRIVTIDVSDEGEGVAEELAPNIFEKGVSGHGSSGIGLALARELARADGSRLELVQRRPPIFRITLSALPTAFQTDRNTSETGMGIAPPRRRFFY